MNYLYKKMSFCILSLFLFSFPSIKTQAQNYNEEELAQLKEFLLQPCHLELQSNKDNGFTYNFHAMHKSNAFAPKDLENQNILLSILDGVKFNDTGRISEIAWGGGSGIGGFSGKLDLSACSELKKFEFRMSDNNRISSITLNATNLHHAEVVSPGTATSVLEEFILTGIEKGEYLPYQKGVTVPYLNCMGNKLTFNKMPKVIVENKETFVNQYFCSGQQDSINPAGNHIGEIIDLHTDYYFDDVEGLMWNNSSHHFGSTEYIWKNENEEELKENTDYTTDGKGHFEFINPSLIKKTVTCEITHNLFKVNTAFEQEPGSYGNDENRYNHNYLTLKYRTTLRKDPTVGIHEETGKEMAAWFSDRQLIIEKTGNALSLVSVYDLSGKQIYNATERSSNLKINAENWQQGVYIIKLTTGKETEIRKAINR
ncbi:MAG: T9SS type A sorting domain-containing protein [Candidatus Azobacteroides sp.]|nr:T9SS type A sorting domain-containing protein [Candidatus Azobacteroides sp.]